MADSLGLTFAPTAAAQQDDKMRQGSPLQQAIQVLSLRLPRIMGARPIAPQQLLGAQGAAGGSPYGNPSAIVQQIMQQILGGKTPPVGVPPTGGIVPQGMYQPPRGGINPQGVPRLDPITGGYGVPPPPVIVPGAGNPPPPVIVPGEGAPQPPYSPPPVTTNPETTPMQQYPRPLTPRERRMV